MRIAILGTRGIPNNYGGFEQCAEFLALGLVKRGYEVLVYNSHNHPYQDNNWEGVQIVHCYDPEFKLGTAGQFIYDLNCIRDLRHRKCDIILQLGYTSSSVWGWLFPRKHSIVTTNMDGLEWKRTKYTGRVRSFLLYAEKLGVKYSDYLIADSIGIQKYLKGKYEKDSVFIPYGAKVFNEPDESILQAYDIVPYEYNLLIARLEPENSIEAILDGVVLSGSEKPFLVIGKHDTPFGNFLKQKFSTVPNIRFVGGIYDIHALNNIRYFSNIYFHGHTVGGTNPSLLEAMSSNSLICANDNDFNRYILGDDALYFSDEKDIAQVIVKAKDKKAAEYQSFIDNNRLKISNVYNWDKIVDQYAEHFNEILRS